MAEKFDLMVIGSGPGGYVSAIRASQLGLKTAVVERAELGGVCLNWGCIPTKALLHSASLYDHLKSGKKFGVIAADLAVDFEGMVKHSRTTAGRLSKGVEFLFKKNKVTTLVGEGTIIAAGKVQVAGAKGDSEIYETGHILIATGARPRAIPGVDFDGKKIISSKEALVLSSQPKSLIIIGAGAIGVEFAYFFNTIGTQTTLVEMMPQILPIEDHEVAAEVTKSFKKSGMKILTATTVDKIAKNSKGVTVTVSSADNKEELKADAALVAIGVQGNYENLGLEKLGIEVDRGYIKVDKRNYKTNIEGIYAIGDIIGPPWLAHVASAEGVTAVEHMAGKNPLGVDYNNIPGCTYCQPQVASVGLTEEKAREQSFDIKVGKVPFRAIGKALAMGHGEGFAKLIFDAKYGELLGAHLVGAEVTDLLAELNVAKTLETTADELMHTIHAHPTLSEVIKEAAEDAFDRAIHI